MCTERGEDIINLKNSKKILLFHKLKILFYTQFIRSTQIISKYLCMSVSFFTYPLCMIRAKCILQNTSFFHLIGETSMHHLFPFLPTTLTVLDEIPIFELSIDFKITCHFAKIHFEKNMFNILHYVRCLGVLVKVFWFLFFQFQLIL